MLNAPRGADEVTDMKRCVMFLAVAAIGLSLAGRPSRAQQHRGGSGFEAPILEFWKQWEGGRPSVAVRNAWPEQREWDAIGRNADDFQNRSGGKCLGHAEIIRKPLSENMEFVAYLALYEPTPLRVQMLYYRSTGTWRLIGLQVDANPARWLAEAAQPEVTDGANGRPAVEPGE